MSNRRLMMSAGPYTLPSCTSASPDGSPVVIANDSAHLAFPSVARMANGNLVVVYRRATQHIGGSNDGIIVARVSDDDGLTWGAEATVWNPANDARDAAVSVASTGTVIVTSTEGNGSSLTDNFFAYVIRSTDNGATWGSPIAVGTTYGTGGNHREVGGSPVVELADGRLMMAIAGRTAAESTSNEHIIVVFSSDDGITWGSPVTAVNTAGVFYTEPYVTTLPGGTLHMLIRRNDTGVIYRTTSSDSGATWAAVVSKFNGKAKPTHLRLVCGTMIFVSRANPNGDTIYRLSTDDGVTWGSEVVLDATLTRNVYAGLVALSRRSALCVYGIEDTGDSSATNADIRSQVFTGA